eukprot:354695-Chlamydomonas_euryale.AAC.3
MCGTCTHHFAVCVGPAHSTSPYVWDLHTPLRRMCGNCTQHFAVCVGPAHTTLPYVWDLHTPLRRMCGNCTQQPPSGPATPFPNLACRRHNTAQRCGGGLVRGGWGFQTLPTEQLHLSGCYAPSRTAAHANGCRMYARKIPQCQPGTVRKVRREVGSLGALGAGARPLPKVERCLRLEGGL